MNLLERIPEHALTVDFAVAGSGEAFRDGWVHRKVAPCTIIAQAVEGRYEVEAGGGKAMTEPGGAFLATGGEWLAITHHGDRDRGGVMKARWLHARWLLHGTVDFVSLLSLPRVIPARAAEPFGRMIDELLGMRRRESTFRDVVRRNELALSALGLLCEASSASPSGLAMLARADRLVPVLTFIRDHLADRLTIDVLSKAARLSRSRLHALFQSHLHISPLDHVKRMRMAQASRRLLLSDLSIKEIAGQCGFANPYHFSREFKVATGVSPLRYRRQHEGFQV